MNGLTANEQVEVIVCPGCGMDIKEGPPLLRLAAFDSFTHTDCGKTWDIAGEVPDWSNNPPQVVITVEEAKVRGVFVSRGPQ